MNKKAQEGSFDIGRDLGYLVITIIILTALFFFIAIFAKGIETNYYSSDYGVEVLNTEERFFNCVAYEDEVTGVKYSKIVDVKKLQTLNPCMGISDERQRKGVKAVLVDLNGTELSSGETLNYIDRPELK